MKFRSGHHAPPTTIRHYGPDGRDILSVGRDRSLRLFSVIRDAQNIELSQGPSLMKKAKQQGIQIDELKLPHVTQFHSCELSVYGERDMERLSGIFLISLVPSLSKQRQRLANGTTF